KNAALRGRPAVADDRTDPSHEIPAAEPPTAPSRREPRRAFDERTAPGATDPGASWPDEPPPSLRGDEGAWAAEPSAAETLIPTPASELAARARASVNGVAQSSVPALSPRPRRLFLLAGVAVLVLGVAGYLSYAVMSGGHGAVQVVSSPSGA